MVGAGAGLAVTDDVAMTVESRRSTERPAQRAEILHLPGGVEERALHADGFENVDRHLAAGIDRPRHRRAIGSNVEYFATTPAEKEGARKTSLHDGVSRHGSAGVDGRRQAFLRDRRMDVAQ